LWHCGGGGIPVRIAVEHGSSALTEIAQQIAMDDITQIEVSGDFDQIRALIAHSRTATEARVEVSTNAIQG